jgi:hypothetical protein
MSDVSVWSKWDDSARVGAAEPVTLLLKEVEVRPKPFSPVAVHEARNAEKIAIETIRHSPVALRDRPDFNTFPLLRGSCRRRIVPRLVPFAAPAPRRERRLLLRRIQIVAIGPGTNRNKAASSNTNAHFARFAEVVNSTEITICYIA